MRDAHSTARHSRSVMLKFRSSGLKESLQLSTGRVHWSGSYCSRTAPTGPAIASVFNV